MRRRTAIGAVGGAALAAGAGTAWWRGREPAVANPDAAVAGPGDVWSHSFETLAGPVLAMQTLRGRPLLLNFWATWCAPCVTEMPLLEAFFTTHSASGWQVLALAIDQKPAVETFLREHRLKLPVALAAGAGLDLSRELGNRVGALPFTVVFASNGAAAETRLGSVSESLLSTWLAAVR